MPKKYEEKTVKRRIEALFLDNIGRVVSREEIIYASRDPATNKEPENWHQRLSELRTDEGYSILSWRDDKSLKPGQYLLKTSEKRPEAHKRIKPTPAAWASILQRANNKCEWIEDGIACTLKEGDIDPVGGGKVKLTPDHITPHSIDPSIDPNDLTKWRVLCSRHQVTKKNFFDSATGKINYLELIKSAPIKIKLQIFNFLKEFFGEK